MSGPISAMIVSTAVMPTPTRLQPFGDVAKGCQRGLDPAAEDGNAFLQLLDRPQTLGEQKSMMLADTTGESLHQCRPCAAQSSNT